MADAMTLDRPEARSTFGHAAGHLDDGSGKTDISPFTDFQRKQYIDLMATMRARVLDMVKGVRDGEIQQRHAQNGLRAAFLKSSFGIFTDGISSVMNFRNPWKLAMWAVNTATTIFDLAKDFGNYKRSLPGFERAKDGLLFTLRTAAHVDSMPKPTHSDGRDIFVEPVLLVPKPGQGNQLDDDFVRKYIPETLDGKFLRDEDKGKPFPLHQVLYGPKTP